MLTITQSRLANVIQAIAQSELLSEKRKSILGELHHFQVEAAFNRLDQSRVGKLASSDLNEFLDDNRIPHSQVEAAYLFKKIDNDRDGRISVGDFSKFIVAKSTRNIVLGRQPYNVEVGMLLPAEVEQALADVFAQELSNYRNINIPRTALINSLDYNALEAFRLLDLFNQGYINIDSLALFMKNQGIILLRDELDAFFQAVDLDQDGKISYSELVEAVHLMEPLPYKPDVPLRSELLNAIENSRSLERIYLSQYPYYFYPYYPYYYPYYYPSLKLESTRERERSLERLHRSRLQQINTESRMRDIENERRRSEERQRSAERLRQIQEESFLRKSQIEEANRIRELDRIQNEELRRSREIIRQAETEARLRQLEIDQQALQIERESRFKVLERESRLRQAERELVDSQIRANIERLSSIERLKQLEDLRRLEADKLRTSQELAYRPYVYNTYQPYYNSAIQKYPYSIIDSVNAFKYFLYQIFFFSSIVQQENIHQQNHWSRAQFMRVHLRQQRNKNLDKNDLFKINLIMKNFESRYDDNTRTNITTTERYVVQSNVNATDNYKYRRRNYLTTAFSSAQTVGPLGTFSVQSGGNCQMPCIMPVPMMFGCGTQKDDCDCEKLDEFKEEIAFLRNRIAELLNREPEVKIVEKTIKVEDTSKITDLELQLSQLRIQLQQEQSRLRAKEDELSELRLKLNKAEAQGDASANQLRFRIQELENQLLRYRTEQDKLLYELKQAQDQLQATQLEANDQYQQTIEEYQSRIDSTRAEVETWKQKFQELLRKHTTLSEERDDIKAELDTLKKTKIEEKRDIQVERRTVGQTSSVVTSSLTKSQLASQQSGGFTGGQQSSSYQVGSYQPSGQQFSAREQFSASRDYNPPVTSYVRETNTSYGYDNQGAGSGIGGTTGLTGGLGLPAGSVQTTTTTQQSTFQRSSDYKPSSNLGNPKLYP